MANLKELSKRTFNVEQQTAENIQLSCLVRIADASEAMAQNHVQLQREVDYYRSRYNELIEVRDQLRQELITQRGLVTRYKNKANLFQRVLQRIMNISPDTGREGCTWGDTEFDSIAAAAGYNQALSNVQVEIIKHTKIR